MIVFSIPNLGCGGCARTVTAALRGAAPGAEVRVDLQRREVAVAGATDVEGLARALREAGFPGEGRGD